MHQKNTTLDLQFPRIKRLKENFFKVDPSISIYRALAVTQIYQENPSMPLELLRANGIYRTVELLPINIDPEQLFVGHPGGKSRSGIFSPDICWRWLEKEQDTVSTRAQDPYVFSEEDKRICREQIYPFWCGKSIEEIIYMRMKEANILSISYDSGVIDCEIKTTSGGCDLVPGYQNILFKKGFGGIKKDAEINLARCSYEIPTDLKKIYFLKAVIIVCDAMILLGKKHAKAALELADQEYDTNRQKELRYIANLCSHVPEHPPKSFHEALQMIWFGQVALYLEENTSGVSPGRVDQYVCPYLEQDLANGRITEEYAMELLYCFLIKFNEIPWLVSARGAEYFAGYASFFNIVVGGQKPNGGDATNRLSYMFLDGMKNLKMYQPSLSARIHNNTPVEFLTKIVEVISAGGGFPALHFDDVTIRILLSRGINITDARNYALMGCVEPYVPGKLFRWTSAVYTNFPVAVELALTNGILRSSGKQVGERTGNITDFKTFEQLEIAVKKQLKYIINISTIATNISQQAHRDYLPKIMSSILVEGCVENSTEIMNGGALYNSGPGIVFVGIADCANSLAAIKKIIFDDKLYTLEELNNALDHDFSGFHNIYQACLNAPKYGNDIDEVDNFAKEILDYVAQEINIKRGLHANMELGTLSITSNFPQGKVIGALPSGRKAAMPLSDGISPSQGTDIKGPTSSIKSVDKINQESTSVGTLFNMKIHPELLASDEGKNCFYSLIKAHNQLGGAQIQFNCITKQQLLAAQKDPEKYRSLVIRVAGYSAFFTELNKEVQNDIIGRTEHGSW